MSGSVCCEKSSRSERHVLKIKKGAKVQSAVKKAVVLNRNHLHFLYEKGSVCCEKSSRSEQGINNPLKWNDQSCAFLNQTIAHMILHGAPYRQIAGHRIFHYFQHIIYS